MKNELLDFCEQWFAAGLNGVYQGVLLTVVVALVLRWLGRTNAATRHAVWFATLLLVVALVPLHWLFERLALKDPVLPVPQASAPTARTLGTVFPEPWRKMGLAPTEQSRAGGQEDFIGPDDPAEVFQDGDELFLGQAGTLSPKASFPSRFSEAAPPGMNDDTAREEEKTAVASGRLTGAPDRGEARVQSVPGSPGFWNRVSGAVAAVVAQAAGWLSPFMKPASWSPSGARPAIKYASALACALWLLLAFVRLGVLAGRMCGLRRLKRSSLPLAPELEALFERVRANLEIRRPVSVRYSTAQNAPVLLGFLHPMVLLPAPGTAAGTTSELEQIFRHELAHVRRRDDWVNLVQNLFQAVLFFHPAVGWLCNRLSLEREIACDDCVLRQGAAPRGYALVLTNLAGRLTASPLAPGLSTNKSQLQQRINMILNTQRDTSARLAAARLGILTSVAGFCSFLALCAGPRLVLAQAPAPAAATPPAGLSATPAPEAPPAPPAAEIAAADPYPGASDVEPGAKLKPEPGQPIPPMPPVIAAKPVPSVPPVIVATGGAMALPKPPRAPEAPNPDASLEERLNRLEKMVQSLMSERRGGTAKAWVFPKNGPDFNPEKDEKLQKELESADQAKQAGRNFEYYAKVQRDWSHAQRDAAKQQLEALRRARESLAREVDRVDREIKRLEEPNARTSEPAPRRSNLNLNHGLNLNLDLKEPRLAGEAGLLDSANLELEAPGD